MRFEGLIFYTAENPEATHPNHRFFGFVTTIQREREGQPPLHRTMHGHGTEAEAIGSIMRKVAKYIEKEGRKFANP